MKNIIGGLFNTQESANLAHQALQKAGFADEQINLFVHEPRNRTKRATKVKIQDIAKNTLFGALIVGAIGGLIGFLVGSGKLSLPGLEPGSVELTPLFLVMSLFFGTAWGGVTGAILGAAAKLLRSREKAEVMTQQIQKRGVLVMVNVDDSQSATRAKRVMEENEAVEVGNPSEKWDLDAWSSPNETTPSAKNLVNTR